MWSGIPISSTQYHTSNLNNGGFYMNQHVPAYAFSVRCVQDLASYNQFYADIELRTQIPWFA